LDDVILNPDIFPDIEIGDFVKVSSPYENTELYLILQVESRKPIQGGKLEVSVKRKHAKIAKLRTLQLVCVEKIIPEDYYIHFVELSFKNQYLTRGFALKYDTI